MVLGFDWLMGLFGGILRLGCFIGIDGWKVVYGRLVKGLGWSLLVG